MARKFQLTWRKDRKCWKKVYKGQPLHFPFGVSKHDKAGYERAWQAFLLRKAEIDAADNQRNNDKPHAALYRSAFAEHARLIGYLQANVGEPDEQLALGWRPRGYNWPADRPFYVPEYGELLDHYTAQLERLQAQFKTLKPPNLETADVIPTYDWGEIGHVAWESRLKEFSKQKSKAAAKPLESLQGNVDRYLNSLKAREKIGEISAAYCHRVQNELAHFVAHVGPNSRVADKLNAATVSSFKADVVGKLLAEKLASSTAAGICKNARTFIKWLWQEEVIDNLPRNVDSLAVAEQVAEIEVFEPAEIAALLAAAPERTKLFVLLMLNCGMYAGDIADLRHSEVDLKAGTIERKRTKVKKMKSPPVVRYTLWPETLRLLKQFATPEPKKEGKPTTLVLLNEDGRPLRFVGFSSTGKGLRVCNVSAALKQLWAKLAKRGIVIEKSPKQLRKTGASTLEKHDDYGRFSNYYLAKSAKTDAEKRYAIPSREQFDKALAWLRKQLLGGKADKRALIVLKGGRPKAAAAD